TGNPVDIGEDVIISHGGTVHGATIGDGSIIGINGVVLDRAVIGKGSIIGSGALVSPRTEIPDNMLALGMPAKPVRECKEREIEYMKKEHERTLSKAKVYKKLYAEK
ncbi:MAG: gamma carbonic anhydrase family protein, partial [Candidatus Bathyarchaeota archaeon]|nr:gamma carbonic anhydrase family protein [Candidatus Bathyarchaeota archaeon]